MRGVLELAALYDETSLQRAFVLAREYNTYSHQFLRGVLESGAVLRAEEAELPAGTGRGLPATAVRCELGVYQRLLEVGR